MFQASVYYYVNINKYTFYTRECKACKAKQMKAV